MKTRMVLLLFILISFKSFAFEFTQDFSEGFYWQNFPISISVSESDPAKRAELEDMLDAAILEWESYTNIDLWNRVPSSSNSIRWSSNFASETGYSESTTLAVTTRHITGPYVRKTEIVLNRNHGLNNYPTHLQTVMVHELGHTIGLDHSYVQGAVMTAAISLNFNGLHNDDKDGLAEVSSQTIQRQESRYVSPNAYSSDNQVVGPSCATVSITGGGSGGGSGPMILSLGLGLIVGLGSRKKAPILA